MCHERTQNSPTCRLSISLQADLIRLKYWRHIHKAIISSNAEYFVIEYDGRIKINNNNSCLMDKMGL